MMTEYESVYYEILRTFRGQKNKAIVSENSFFFKEKLHAQAMSTPKMKYILKLLKQEGY